MKKLFTTMILGSMLVFVAGCGMVNQDQTPVESGTTNEEYVGNPTPSLEMDFVQTEEEKAVYDQYTEDVKNGGNGDEADAPAFKH